MQCLEWEPILKAQNPAQVEIQMMMMMMMMMMWYFTNQTETLFQVTQSPDELLRYK